MGERRYARPAMVAEYQTGAHILLAHWHYCNKGSQPFALDWDKDQIFQMAELDEGQITFVKTTSAWVRSHGMPPLHLFLFEILALISLNRSLFEISSWKRFAGG